MKNFLYWEGIKIASLVQKLRSFYWRGGFCLLSELHWEKSAPAAGAADLFTSMLASFGIIFSFD